MAAKVECARCDRKFDRSQIDAGQFEPETMICYFCYGEMQSGGRDYCQAPHQLSCFGKFTESKKRGFRRNLLGFNPNAEECKHWCPDRHVCARIMGYKGE